MSYSINQLKLSVLEQCPFQEGYFYEVRAQALYKGISSWCFGQLVAEDNVQHLAKGGAILNSHSSQAIGLNDLSVTVGAVGQLLQMLM